MAEFTDYYKLTNHGVKVGDTLAVHVAHKYENGSWSAWSVAEYHVDRVYFDYITMYKTSDVTEGLRLTPKNMKSGQFKVVVISW